jgi:hypothetical protein
MGFKDSPAVLHITLARTASATFGSTIDHQIRYNKKTTTNKGSMVAEQIVAALMRSLLLHLL